MQKKLLVSNWRLSIARELLRHFTFACCIQEWHNLQTTELKTLYHAVFAAAHLNAVQIDTRLYRAIQHWAFDEVANNNFFAGLFMQILELNIDSLCDHTDETCLCSRRDKMRQAYRCTRQYDMFFMNETVPMPGNPQVSINMFEACILFCARASNEEMTGVMQHFGMCIALCIAPTI